MDFLSNLQKHENQSEQQQHTNKPDHHSSTNNPTTNHNSSSTYDNDHKPTNSELMNSCKIVADAAKSQFGNQQTPETKYDKHKLASAAANILDAAGDYGKLDDQKGVGKYVEQAEEYLRKYGGGGGSGEHHGGVGGGSGEHHGGGGGGSGEHYGGGVPEKKGHGESGGGSDYMKMAQGFLHGKDDKTGGGGHGGSSDFMKMAGDFLKK